MLSICFKSKFILQREPLELQLELLGDETFKAHTKAKKVCNEKKDYMIW